jgi:hypothetical protein
MSARAGSAQSGNTGVAAISPTCFLLSFFAAYDVASARRELKKRLTLCDGPFLMRFQWLAR